MPHQPTDTYFVTAAEGSRHEIFPGVNLKAVAGRELMLSVVTFEVGAIVSMHEHPHEQMGLLISGSLEFTIGGETRVLVAGDIWRIPGGVPHTVKALDRPAIALDVFHPIREDYL